jgi:excisionase family DNA binding protein
LQSIAGALSVAKDRISSSLIAPAQQAIPSLLSVAEAAAALGVSPITVRRRIASGELSAVRVGERGAVRIDAAALDELCQPYIDPKEAA